MIISDNAGNVTVTPSDFPSPCKVNRCISVFEWILEQSGLLFPSPLEVDRFISGDVGLTFYQNNQFPSPLKVDRFISVEKNDVETQEEEVTVHSRGR